MKKTDLEFLQEMRALTQSLINGKYDITKVEHLDKMIQDWIDELNTKKGRRNVPSKSEILTKKIELANLIREKIPPIKFKKIKGNSWSGYFPINNNIIHVCFKYYLDRPEKVNTVDIMYCIDGTYKPLTIKYIRETIEIVNSL